MSATDEQLWETFCKGDEMAFSALFRRYHRPLLAYAQTFTRHQQHIADCVQDVFVDIWLYRQTLTRVSSVKGYLFTSVRNRVARLHQRDLVFRQTYPVDELEFMLEFSVEEQLIADEETAAQVKQLNQLINALPPHQREALYLRYHQGLSVEQVAQTMGMNYQSAVNLLHRAVVHLRRKWRETFPSLAILFLCYF